VNDSAKRLSKPIGNGRCGFCGQRLRLGVSSAGVRIFRCGTCGLFGQALTPPRKFRPKPSEKKRRRQRWHIAS